MITIQKEIFTLSQKEKAKMYAELYDKWNNCKVLTDIELKDLCEFFKLVSYFFSETKQGWLVMSLFHMYEDMQRICNEREIKID